MEATHMSNDIWMDKENMMYIYTMEYNAAFKKEGNTVICDSMDEPRGY